MCLIDVLCVYCRFFILRVYCSLMKWTPSIVVLLIVVVFNIGLLMLCYGFITLCFFYSLHFNWFIYIFHSYIHFCIQILHFLKLCIDVFLSRHFIITFQTRLANLPSTELIKLISCWFFLVLIIAIILLWNLCTNFNINSAPLTSSFNVRLQQFIEW